MGVHRALHTCTQSSPWAGSRCARCTATAWSATSWAATTGALQLIQVLELHFAAGLLWAASSITRKPGAGTADAT